MSRHSSSESYGHSIRRCFYDCYDISWTVDRYCKGSRLRFPTTYTRDTDHAGALRFAKKWDIAPPEDKS